MRTTKDKIIDKGWRIQMIDNIEKECESSSPILIYQSTKFHQ